MLSISITILIIVLTLYFGLFLPILVFLLFIPISWVILQFRKDGKSAWSQLKPGWDTLHCRHLYQVFGGICGLTILLILFLGLYRSQWDNPKKDDDSSSFMTEQEAAHEFDISYQESLDSINPTDKEIETLRKASSIKYLREFVPKFNQYLPVAVGEGLKMTRVSSEGDNLYFLVECDPNIMNMDKIKYSYSEMSNKVIQNLRNPALRNFVQACYDCDKYIIYKFMAENSLSSKEIKIYKFELKEKILDSPY